MMDAQVRHPRGAVKVNGRLVLWTSWEVNNNTNYQADTFAVTLPISGQPEGVDLTFWARATSIEVEIFAGFPADPSRPDMSEMTSLILGAADDIAIDPKSMTIQLSGRDFTARLIDDQTTNKWQNMKSSDIVTAIAKSKNLKPVVVPTKARAGKFYNIDHAKLDSQRTKWDVVCYLAHNEGYQVYVKGDNLYFEPMAEEESDPYIVEWDATSAAYPHFEGMDLKFSRNLTLSRDVVVHVRSWNSKSVKGFTKTAKAKRSRDPVLRRSPSSATSALIGEPQVYSYVVPNLTPEQALNMAENKLKLITQHEMRVTITMPGDNILMPSRPILVTGTGAYDQIYHADTIIRRMSVTNGYTMDISGKNHNTDSYKVV